MFMEMSVGPCVAECFKHVFGSSPIATAELLLVKGVRRVEFFEPKAGNNRRRYENG